MSYAMTITVEQPYDTVLGHVRRALAGQGFGILSEIDLKTTLKNKLDVDIAPQVILGACRPPLAYAALQAEPSIGLLLPCNVVVRSTSDHVTVVEAVNPQSMVAMTANPGLQTVADDATQRLTAALDSLVTELGKETTTDGAA
jgi:uncharacterized protein (DUF302 family)